MSEDGFRRKGSSLKQILNHLHPLTPSNTFQSPSKLDYGNKKLESEHTYNLSQESSSKYRE